MLFLQGRKTENNISTRKQNCRGFFVVLMLLLGLIIYFLVRTANEESVSYYVLAYVLCPSYEVAFKYNFNNLSQFIAYICKRGDTCKPMDEMQSVQDPICIYLRENHI